MKQEFWEKLLEARKCEMEAICTLLPERVRPHMEVIQKEAAAMAKECLQSGKKDDKNKKVRKVNLD